MLTKYKSIFVILLLLIHTQASAKEHHKQHTKHQLVGVGSWYGPRFNGKKTSSGERFNQNRMTASHKTLPFGTKVKVTNLENNKSVTVTINDRGPFIHGRIIDLSKSAARSIGMDGTQKVSLRILG